MCIAYNGIAQSFLNLDFEFGVVKSQPRKWSIEGEGDNYFAKLDSSVAKSGSHSLYITQTKADVYTFLRLPRADIAGTRIKVEGYVKLSEADSLQVRFMLAEPGGHTPVISNQADTKQRDWQLLSIESSFPANYTSDRLLIALTTSGTGKLWLDNVRITINGKSYGNGQPDFREPTEEEIKTLNAKAIPIKSLNLEPEAKDLAPLKDVIGNATIVALGENSHGSSSIYQLKLSLVKYLVKELGFTVFALETPVVEADKINQYVLYGKGTREDVVTNLVYKSWQTPDMLNIIEWLKSYNETANKKVEFRGFDMQNGMPALDTVQNFARKNDKDLFQQITELKGYYEQTKNQQLTWDSLYKKANEVYKYMGSKTTSDYSGIGKNDLSKIIYYMNIFLQSLSSNYKSDLTKTRDEYMAENIDWIVRNSGNDSKIIVSADNTHITKESGKTGSYLKHIYGDKYLAFGFTFNTGTYTAYGKEKYYEVHPPYAGTYEYLFSKCRYKNFLLDIRNTNNIPILNQPAGFRSIGSKPQETTQFADIILKNHFDVIVFIENSIHTTYLNE